MNDSKIFATLQTPDGDTLATAHAYEAGNFRFNWNSYLDITLVLKGSIRLHTQEGTYEMSEDMFVFINPNVAHAALSLQKGSIALVLTISEQYIKQYFGFVPVFQTTCDPDCVNAPLSQAIRSCIASFFLSLAYRNTKFSDHFAKSQLDLLLALSQTFHATLTKEQWLTSQKNAFQQARGQELLHYINEHFQENLTLKDVASHAGMNASYLSAYFRTNLGIGFYEYLIRQRLSHAVYLLNHTSDSILDIALDSGFSDLKPFYSAFNKYLHISPGKYRKALHDQTKEAPIGASVELTFDTPAVLDKLLAYSKTSFSAHSILVDFLDFSHT